MLIFDCNTQDLIKATLIPGNVYTSRKIVEFTGPILKDYKSRYPKIKLKFRADNGFATPELYKLCETHKTEHSIRLKSNATIIKKFTELSEEVIGFYCDRGEMENFSKECKNAFGLCKMSSTSYIANAMKLQRKALAYNINNWFSRLVLPSVYKDMRIETIRVNLIKVAAKIVKHSRYIHFKSNSAYPYKELFIDTFKNIKSLACLRI